MKALERDTEAANARAQKAEKALEIIRQQHRDSDEGQSMREVTKLKNRLIEVECQLERERAAKDEMASEQEHYRLAAHKLVSPRDVT